MDSKADVVERHRDRGMGFVNRHVDRGDRLLGEADVGQALGECLDEVDGVGGDRLVQALGELTVVDRSRQVVHPGRDPGVERQLDVDDELLAVSALCGKYPVVPDGTYPPKPQPVGRPFLRVGYDAPPSSGSLWSGSGAESTGEA
jgi:hypothetical protein